MHGPLGTVHSPSTQLPEWLGPGKGKKCTAHLSLYPYKAPKNLSGINLGRVHEIQGPLGAVSLQSTLEPEQCGPGKYMLAWTVTNSVWSIHCEHSPHRPVVFVYSVLPSPQNN